jgi:hypothetical protein
MSEEPAPPPRKKPRQVPSQKEASQKKSSKKADSEASRAHSMELSSKTKVAHFRIMGRLKMAWRAHHMHHTDHRILSLPRKLKHTKQELQRTKWDFLDAKWALHELPNGAANPAIQLYRAGELLERIDYPQRDRIWETIWRAVAAMKSSQR